MVGSWLVSLGLAAAGFLVQDAPATVAEPAEPVATMAQAHLPAGTPLDFEFVDRVHSKLNKSGDVFRIRLSKPITANGAVLVPAGAEGQGEVVHAARARAGGKAGELILAARFVEHGGARLVLRGFRFGQSGDNKTSTALAVGMAAGPLAYFIVGGEVDVPPGTPGNARLAADFVPAPPSQAAAIVVQP